MKHKAKAPDLDSTIKNLNIVETIRLSAPEAANPDRYFYWDELKYRPTPEGLSSEAWWVGVKLHRQLTRTNTPLLDQAGKAFTYSLMPQFISKLHQIDVLAGVAPDNFGGGKVKPPLYTDSIIEESIMSSKLEGAIITRAEARNMLKQNRPALNEHERMVRNNYRTMQYLLAHRDEALSPEIVLELHRLMTEDTLDKPEMCGKLRTSEHWVRVEHAITGDIIHVPPPAEQLPERLQDMCNFANGSIGGYMHPVLRAIILHFWLAFDHPFVDGNGRTARALFYWAMLRAGYHIVEYIAISREISQSPKGYYKAFQDAEFDDNDLNYFIFNQLQTIIKALNKLAHIVYESEETVMSACENSFDLPEELNLRQQAFLRELTRERGYGSISITGYCDQFKVVRQTARTDLGALVDAGILYVKKQGKQYIYLATPEFRDSI